MPIRILAVGKKHEPWIEDGIERYHKRLRKPFDAEWVLLPHSTSTGLTARQEESERIVSRLRAEDYVVLLDERGRLLTSPQLSEALKTPLETARPVVFVIGGAYGVDENLMQRADLAWSLSPLVFPHQLVRLILAEQLYRAQEIKKGNPYHHD
jgi:23S rRNA (pseudouridine1915-N3)-methyltransferase